MSPAPIVRNIIDNDQFEEMRDLLEDEFVDLVQVYLADSKERIVTMRDALLTRDNAKGFDAAHTLKGASANIGALRLTDLCYELQEACRHQKIDQKSELIDRIEAELRAVQQEINLRLGQ